MGNRRHGLKNISAKLKELIGRYLSERSIYRRGEEQVIVNAAANT